MGQPLDLDELGLGFVGYTLEEGQAILAGAPTPIVGPSLPCIHRSPAPIRTDICDLCSLRSQTFEIFGCALHGECSLHKKHSQVKGCAACRDRSSPTS